MTSDFNRQWRVAARPVGNVKRSDFEYREEPIPTPGDGEFLLETLYLGLVPVMRMYMLGGGAAGEKALEIGDLIHGRGVARVVESNHPDYAPNEIVHGQLGWQTHKVSGGSRGERFIHMRDHGLPVSLGVSTLGMTGFSAYFGFVDCGKPRAGDQVVVSGAGGGVGSVVVQLAKIFGCRVIAITGGKERCHYVRTLGADDVIDYKSESIDERLADLCPGGLDLVFDNVGGDTLSACMEHLAFGATVVLCGSISEYLSDTPYGLTNYTRLRGAHANMTGFFIYNYESRFAEAETAMARWIKHGSLQVTEDVMDGFDNMPEALARLYDSANAGIQICRVRGEPENAIFKGKSSVC